MWCYSIDDYNHELLAIESLFPSTLRVSVLTLLSICLLYEVHSSSLCLLPHSDRARPLLHNHHHKPVADRFGVSLLRHASKGHLHHATPHLSIVRLTTSLAQSPR